MENCPCMERIELHRSEMVRLYAACHNFTDLAVVKVSQELDVLLLDYSYCNGGKHPYKKRLSV